MITIYASNGTTLASVLKTKDAVHEEELMTSNFVRLSWYSEVKTTLPVGSYIIPYSDNVKYILLDPYSPVAEDNRKYKYEPQFQHPVMWLSRLPFIHLTGDTTSWATATKKYDWSYTGVPSTMVTEVKKYINWLGTVFPNIGAAIGTNWTTQIGTGYLPPMASFDFNCLDVLSALAEMASKCDCEYHLDFTNKKIRFGKVEFLGNGESNRVVLKSGLNVKVPSVTESKESYHNCFVVKGGTRNMSQVNSTGENVQVTERLSLDSTQYPDSMIDVRTSQNEPILVKELIFDDIYPKMELYLYNPRERVCYLLDSDGNKVEDSSDPTGYKTYSKWYIRLAYQKEGVWYDYTINPDTDLIKDRPLSLVFQPNYKSGAYPSPLTGKEFELVYFSQQTTEHEEDDVNPNGFTANAGDYRIVFQEGDPIIPTSSSGGLYPRGSSSRSTNNNIVTLFNVVVEDTYKKVAQDELLSAAQREITRLGTDLNTYVLPSNPVYFKNNTPVHYIGQAITFNDGQDLNGGSSYTLNSHIRKMVTRLDHPEIVEISIGNEKIKGPISSLREDVDELSKSVGINGEILSENDVINLIIRYGNEMYLSKQKDDTAKGTIRFLKGIQIAERFISGLLGEGGVFRKESDGTTYIEADKLYIRMKAYFDTVEIRKYLHSGGNRIASVAGVKCVRVEWLDSTGDVLEQTDGNLSSVAKFRCYFRGSDGESLVTNDFLEGDLAYCHITNAESSSSLYQHHFWRLVVGKSTETNDDGEHYIDLSNANNGGSPVMVSFSYEGQGGTTHTMSALSFQAGSDIPVPQDDIIQLGSVNFQDRRGAIIEFVSGADAPSYQIFQDLGSDATNPYSLTGKNYVRFGYDSASGGAQVYIGNPDGSTYLWYHNVNNTPQLDIKANVTFTSPDPEYGTSDLNDFIDAVTRDVSNIHSQIDGEIDTWFYAHSPVAVDEHGAPTSTTPLNVPPYSEWDTEAKKEAHLGDIFYNTATGYAFRFEGSGQTGSRTYSWGEIQDSAVITALENAKDAYDLADNKRRVFVEQPTPPYEEGDLWANATYPSDYTGDTDASQNKYHNDLLRCNTSRSSGSFDITEWELASKYTSDAKLNAFLNGYQGTLTTIRNQIDKKAETWYQGEDPSDPQSTSHWNDDNKNHVGDMWYCTVDIQGTNYKKDTTWQYVDKGSGANPRYRWQQQNIPQSVFDTIDTKKAIYTTWGAWVVDGTSILEDGDLYIPSEDHVEGSGASAVTYKANNVYKWNETANEWQKTEDQELLDFLNGYGGTLQNYVKTQVDKKAETWVSSSNPATAWYDSTQSPVYDVRDEHVGDMWLNSGKSTIDGVESMQTAIYTKSTSNNTTTYGWSVDPSIPNSVFDTIDGKKSIYVSRPTTYEVRDMWIIEKGLSSTYMPTGCQSGDIVISSASRTNNYKKADWSKKDRYTDDTRINNFVNEILNGTGATGDDQTVADAIKAVNDALYKNTTTIEGGLILSSMIALKNSGTTWAGISGVYDTSAYGNGIAAWYGGGRQDRYNSSTGAFGSTGAKTVFRMDGSGYVASGNIYWDNSGNVNIQGVTINATTLKQNNSSVATESMLANYLLRSAGSDQALTGTLYSQSIFPKTDNTYNLGGTNNYWKYLYTKRIYLASGVYLEYNSTSGSQGVHLVGAGFYSDSFVSAFGIGTSGGGGTVSLCAPLNNINNNINQNPAVNGATFVWNDTTGKFVYSNADGQKLYVGRGGLEIGNSGNLTVSGSATVTGNVTVIGGGFVKSDSSNDYVLLAGGGTKLLSEIGGGGSVNSITIGSGGTNYTPDANGVITIPAYVTLTGAQTITGKKNFSGTGADILTVDRNSTSPAWVKFANNGTLLGFLGVDNSREARFYNGTNNNKIWHSGNFTPSDYALASELSSYALSANVYSKTDVNGFTWWGRSLSNGAVNGNITVTELSSANTYVSVSNAAGTIKLQCAPSYRGLYDGTSLVLVSNGTNVYSLLGNFGIGTNSPTSKLHVAGETKTNNLAISSTSAEAHISFARSSHNYIQAATEGGNIRFVTNGKSISAAHTDMLISDGAVSVTGTFEATGNSTIGGTLGVTDATTLSSTLTVAGTTTLQGHVYISNNKYIYYKDNPESGTAANIDILRLSSSNNLVIGYGVGPKSYDTYLQGYNVYLRYGTSRTTGLTLSNAGLVTLANNLVLGSSDNTYIKIGDLYLSYDSSNNALRVSANSDGTGSAHLYATGAVSAFGIGSSSSGLSLCAPLNNINTNILSNPTVNGATFVWNGNTSKFVYSNTSGQTLNAYNISVSSALSAYTGSFGSTLEAVNMTVTGGNLTVQTGNLTVSAGRAGIAGATSSSYTLYVHGNIRSNYLAIGATEDVNSLSCATIKTLSSRGLSVQTNGNAACYTNVAWSVSSDIRLKHIVSNVGASIEQIADAPIFNFRWLSGGNDTILGSSAQYWQAVFPCAVRGDMNSFLSMDYGGVALAAAVITARKVVDHEQRIRQLEIENEELKKELKQLKAA